MSKLKGMVVFAVSEPLEDGRFFIKKSILDGSLAILMKRKKLIGSLDETVFKATLLMSLLSFERRELQMLIASLKP